MYSCCSRPQVSVGGALFVSFTAAHGVAPRGSLLMAVVGVATVAAVVPAVNVIAVGPTVVGIVVPFSASSGYAFVLDVVVVGVLVGILVVGVATEIVGTAVVIGIVVVAAIGLTGLQLLDLVAQLGNFGVLDGVLLN
jgi:hypothetical protein